MPVTFHALASGSSGNACLLEVDGFGVLIDFGLGPRQLARRLEACGLSWDRVRAALLTHTHGDHWNAQTLAEFLERRVEVHCHREHALDLTEACDRFEALQEAGLVRGYEVDDAWDFPPGCRCRALALPHDSGVTCGFRIEGQGWTLGYAADLGSWDDELADALADVDILALEFNHDVDLQRRSGRPYFLIRRVLGDSGHLSNAQAVRLVDAILARSEPGRLQHLIQLHVSADCNAPDVARAAAQRLAWRSEVRFQVHTATQDEVGPCVRFDPRLPRPFAGTIRSERRVFVQARLPGWE